jgi:molybdate transport system permease protein
VSLRRGLLAASVGALAAALLAFTLLPVVAIFARTSPGTLAAQLRSPRALDALGISLRTSTVALAVVVLVGTPVAYVLARARFRGHAVVTTLVELPLVLPPAVAGIGLLAAFGRFGLLGGPLRALGLEIPFTQVAVVMALAFVAMPFHVRQAMAAFRSVDPDLLGSARTLGAGPVMTFARVAVPVAGPGLVAGAALAWARALGEFGATLLFAGSFPGRTQTLSLAIYANLSDFPVALAMAGVLVAVSAGLLVGVKLLLRGAEPFDPAAGGRR